MGLQAVRPVVLIGTALAVFASSQANAALDAASLFQRGQTPEAFLATVSAQRHLWITNTSRAIPDALVRRLTDAGANLQLLAVAEDWCPDSANTIPYVATLAARAHVPFRIVDRTVGRALMERHRSEDGRPVTPLIVLLRRGIEVAAWVERPAPLQQLFRSMGASQSAADAFAHRQDWYDRDRGVTAMTEIVRLAETSPPRR